MAFNLKAGGGLTKMPICCAPTRGVTEESLQCSMATVGAVQPQEVQGFWKKR